MTDYDFQSITHYQPGYLLDIIQLYKRIKTVIKFAKSNELIEKSDFFVSK